MSVSKHQHSLKYEPFLGLMAACLDKIQKDSNHNLSN